MNIKKDDFENLKLDINNELDTLLSTEVLIGNMTINPETQCMEVSQDLKKRIFSLAREEVLLTVGKSLFENKGDIYDTGLDLLSYYRKCIINYFPNKKKIIISKKYNKEMGEKFKKFEQEVEKIREKLEGNNKEMGINLLGNNLNQDINDIVERYYSEYNNV